MEHFQNEFPKAVVLVVNCSLKTSRLKESVENINESKWSKTVQRPVQPTTYLSGSDLYFLQTICQSLCIARSLDVRTEIFQG